MYTKEIQDRIDVLKEEHKLLSLGLIVDLIYRNVQRFYMDEAFNMIEEVEIGEKYWDNMKEEGLAQVQDLKVLITEKINKFNTDLEILADDVGEDKETFFEEKIKYVKKIDISKYN
jgi:hypothetical protein